jgi:hypothetical protein
MAGPGKKELARQLDEINKDYNELTREYYALSSKLHEAERKAIQAERKRNYAGALSFDYWPPSDWVRLKLDKWKPGNQFQICVGPIRFDFWED